MVTAGQLSGIDVACQFIYCISAMIVRPFGDTNVERKRGTYDVSLTGACPIGGSPLVRRSANPKVR